MVRVCAYPGCGKRMKRYNPETFHRLPLQAPNLKQWLVVLQLDVKTPVHILKQKDYRVCSGHFDADDFNTPTRGSNPPKRVHLKKTAIPKAPLIGPEESTSGDMAVYASGIAAAPQSMPKKSHQQQHKRSNLSSGLRLALSSPIQSLFSMISDGPEKRVPPGQDSELGKSVLGHSEHERDWEENEDTEDTAQFSDELVITKVEDFTNEMAMDQNEDYNGAQRAKGVENKTMDACAVATQTFDKRLNSDEVSVKDEPIEEWKEAPMGNVKEDEDFDQTPNDVKMRAAFPVGVNNATIVGKAPSIPAEPPQPLKRVGLLCTACNKIMFKRQKTFQCSGSSKFYCSTECLYSTKKKTCHSCLKEICDSSSIIAAVDICGTVKEFCSQKCRSALSFQCSVCQKTGVSHKHEVNLMGYIHKLCSESCFDQFRSSNKLNMNSCVNCGGYCYGTDAHLQMEGKVMKFCGQRCLTAFKKRSLKLITCKMCHNLRPAADAFDSPNSEGIRELFCSASCVTASEAQTVSSPGVPVECNNCKLKLVPQYHTSTFDGSVQNFCSFSCVLEYQEIKCAMCWQTKKMTESVKWLGEMKHFCSLRCLMFFCRLQRVTGAAIKAQSKSLTTQCATPVSSICPLSTKEDTPVIANVVSLSSASSKGSGPESVTEIKCDEKVRVSSSQSLKNKDMQNKSTSKNKATSCKPHTSDAETQIGEAPKVIVLPVPVPVFVPVPMHLYSQYVPQSVGLPVPVPVPLFFPTSLDSAEHIVQTIQEIKEKIPDDPLEADLIMMAEMVAEAAEKEKQNTSAGQTGHVMEELDLEDLSSALSWEEDSVSSVQTRNQTGEPERPPPSRSDTLTPVPTAAEEPQMDLEADFSVETIRLLREQLEKDSGKRRSGKRGHDGAPQKKKGHKCASVPSNSLSKLQRKYGVRAWSDWVLWRNAQHNMDPPKFVSHSMTLKEDLLKCCTAELSYGLCKFISEVRRPNGHEYSPDSIFYLCLGIQQYLFENNRMENIFADVFYTKFSYEMSNILKGWKPTILPSGYVHSRVEEEYLWDCKQLGAFSPGVLLNTLLYFFTKHFNYRTAEQHRRLSFAKIRRYSRGPANNKVSFLRFYPQNEDTSTDGVPVKKRKKDEQQQVLKIRHNSENPLRCPVKLYEFYLSKCAPGIRQDTTMFYLSPEQNCVHSSPTWFSTRALSDEDLDSMIARLLTVRELHLDRDKTPDHKDSDSDSDFSPF